MSTMIASKYKVVELFENGQAALVIDSETGVKLRLDRSPEGVSIESAEQLAK